MAGFSALEALAEAFDAEVSVLTDMELIHAEMHRARGVTDKCVLAALAEAAGTEGSVPRDMVLDLAKLQRVRDLADKRLLAPLAEAASAELSDNTASTGAASANSSSVVSSSSTATSDVMEICRRLSYGDSSAIPAAASSTTFFTASAADGTNASADSTVTQVAAPADSNTAGAGAEAASAELSNKPTAAALRMRLEAFWGKVLVGIIAATIFSVVAVTLFGGRRSNASNVLPPTFPAAASGMKQQMELVPEGLADPAPLLDLPDPDDASSTTFFSASAGSTVTQVAAPADSNTAGAGAKGPVLTDMELLLAKLHRAQGLTDKRLLAALAEDASAELSDNTASTGAASANSSSVVSSSSTATSDVMEICKRLPRRTSDDDKDGDGSTIHAMF